MMFDIAEERVQWGHLLAELYRRRFEDVYSCADEETWTAPEVEIEEKVVLIQRHSSGSGHNWKSQLLREYDRETYAITREYFSQARRCHGGTDNRRYRRDDATGKVIGNNHRRRRLDRDIDKNELIPVAAILYNGDNTCRHIRIG